MKKKPDWKFETTQSLIKFINLRGKKFFFFSGGKESPLPDIYITIARLEQILGSLNINGDDL